MYPELNIKDYFYELPDDRIAKYPLSERDLSRLLVYDKGKISDEQFGFLPTIFRSGDMLVFNNSKVMPARLIVQKETGTYIEILLLEPFGEIPPVLELEKKFKSTWKVMVGNLKKFRVQESILKQVGDIKVAIRLLQKEPAVVEFSWEEPVSFAEILVNWGSLPIPPYLNRDTESIDNERYQTVYAKQDGSVAAPTAGLHFNQRIMDALEAKGVQLTEVTLHVGAGTFQPVKVDNPFEHPIHAENMEVDIPMLSRLSEHQGRIIPVGTTSLRTLESLYWIGHRLVKYKEFRPALEKTYAYEQDAEEVSRHEAFRALKQYMIEHDLKKLLIATRLFILPGYRFKVADVLVTNFHQPGSTLLLLVDAFTGGNWKQIYEHALERGYRFLSYGDSSVLIR